MISDRGGDGNAAGFGQCFQSGGDIDTIAEDVALLNDYIAQMDANPKFDALIFKH
jgi:hypothetical protein